MYSNFINIIDILGTFAFAVSGVFSAMEKKLDLFGVLIIAFVTAIGGGTIRDVLVGNLPVNWLQNDVTIFIIFISALATIVFGSYFKHLNTALIFFDALGLGLFTIIGLQIGLEKNSAEEFVLHWELFLPVLEAYFVMYCSIKCR